MIPSYPNPICSAWNENRVLASSTLASARRTISDEMFHSFLLFYKFFAVQSVLRVLGRWCCNWSHSLRQYPVCARCLWLCQPDGLHHCRHMLQCQLSYSQSWWVFGLPTICRTYIIRIPNPNKFFVKFHSQETNCSFWYIKYLVSLIWLQYDTELKPSLDPRCSRDLPGWKPVY